MPSPVFVGILAVFVVSGWMCWTKFGNVKVDVFLFIVTGWLVSLCLHEYAHAIAGFFSGDKSVADRGYLRLNPLKYTSPLLSIVLPVVVVVLGGIGLPGGAVWIDHQHIRSRVKASLISAAGPLTNVILALVLAVPFLAGFGNVRVDVFLMVICGWLLSLCLHEYAHAIVAFAAGDRGVAERGYLRLNPLKYTHPVLSIVLPIIAVVLGGIGLPGGAVWVDHAHITSKVKQSLISVAGPMTNVIFALLLAVPFLAGLGPQITESGGQFVLTGNSGHLEFWSALALLAFLQVTASVLNFLPVPGLDGGNIIHPWLSVQYQRAYNLFAPYGFILLFALLWQSRINGWFFSGVYWLAELIGIPRALSAVGFELMRFWSGT